MRGLSELALFAGCGGGCLASRGLRHRVVGYVEWEDFPQAVLQARIRDGHLDAAPIFGDVRAFVRDGWARRYRGRVDLVSAGFPCFAAGTFVLTRRGHVRIEDVAVGDECLTHRGRWRRVTAVMRRGDAPLVRVDAGGVPGVVTTPEHPFFARDMSPRWNSAARAQRRQWGEPRWVEAASLSGKFLGQVLPPVEPDERPEAFWWLVGRYLADGWRVARKGRRAGRVVFGIGRKKAHEFAKRVAAAGFHATEVHERTAIKFHVSSGWLYEFLEPFGRLAHGKHLAASALALDSGRAGALLDGYLSGDGHDNGTVERASTTSKALALGIALLAHRARGVVAGVRPGPAGGSCSIEGRAVNTRDSWIVDVPRRNRSAILDGQYGWKLVRRVSDYGRGDVYNLAVEEDESYVADGAIVHNCQPFSVAGKRAAHGDERNMWPATRDVLREVRPGLAFLENVPGLLSVGDGSADAPRYFGTVLADLAELGFNAQWGVLGAHEVGAPHQRDRLWILAYLPDAIGDGVRLLAERHQRSERGEPAAERGDA